MPTNFTTGTINQPNAGAVGQAMVERIRDDLVAHPAWDLVEEYYPASGINRYYIFKCLAASSGLASDFYLVFARRLSDGALWSAICEDYNAATHTMQFYAPNGYSSSGQIYDAQGRVAANTFVLPATALTFGNTTPAMFNWTPGGTSTKWWLCVYDDGFAVAFSGTSNGWMYGGVYTPLSSQTNDMPIYLNGSQTTAMTAGAMTRNPAAAGITYYPAGLFALADIALGVAGDFRYNDKLQANQRSVAEVAIRTYQYNTGDLAIYGSLLGKLRHMRTGNGQVPAGMSFGDAYVLQNRLWVPPSAADARVWDTGVAST